MPKRYRPEIRRKVPDLLKAGLTQRPFRNGPIRLREARLKAVGHFVVFELAIESWCCDTRSPSIKDQDRSRTDRARIAHGRTAKGTEGDAGVAAVDDGRS